MNNAIDRGVAVLDMNGTAVLEGTVVEKEGAVEGEVGVGCVERDSTTRCDAIVGLKGTGREIDGQEVGQSTNNAHATARARVDHAGVVICKGRVGGNERAILLVNRGPLAGTVLGQMHGLKGQYRQGRAVVGPDAAAAFASSPAAVCHAVLDA